MSEEAKSQTALREVTFGSVSSSRLGLVQRINWQMAGMTAKLFEHPFDLG